jgi:SnoaL-like domain
MVTQSTENESLELPQPVVSYFAANKGDMEAFSRCFTENAVVQDEGKTYRGLGAIKEWKANASTEYQYTSVPFASEVKDGKIIVTSRVTGNFPGSPVDLRYFFQLNGNKIASLEIVF